MIAHVAAVALLNEAKVLAHPASVDNLPTSGGKEDHVSMGMTGGAEVAHDRGERRECARDRTARGGGGTGISASAEGRRRASSAPSTTLRAIAPPLTKIAHCRRDIERVAARDPRRKIRSARRKIMS